jgi:hypothetical protein
MISNERQWPHLRRPQHDNRQPYRQNYNQAQRPNYNYAPQQPRPFVQEDTLKSVEFQIERKAFILTLKENPRGRFIRITEENGTRHSSIIIPSTGVKDFQKLLEEMVKASEEIPAKTEPAQEQA